MTWQINKKKIRIDKLSNTHFLGPDIFRLLSRKENGEKEKLSNSTMTFWEKKKIEFISHIGKSKETLWYITAFFWRLFGGGGFPIKIVFCS